MQQPATSSSKNSVIQLQGKRCYNTPLTTDSKEPQLLDWQGKNPKTVLLLFSRQHTVYGETQATILWKEEPLPIW